MPNPEECLLHHHPPCLGKVAQGPRDRRHKGGVYEHRDPTPGYGETQRGTQEEKGWMAFRETL